MPRNDTTRHHTPSLCIDLLLLLLLLLLAGDLTAKGWLANDGSHRMQQPARKRHGYSAEGGAVGGGAVDWGSII